MAELKPIDVICKHSKEGQSTPLKIRVVDEDGENQKNDFIHKQMLTGVTKIWNGKQI